MLTLSLTLTLTLTRTLTLTLTRYENLQINPLAGCLPALAQIPIFLGVYYSVTSIAKAAIIQVRARGRGWG